MGNHDDAHKSKTRCIGLRPSWGVVSASKSMQGLPQWSINTFATPKTLRSWHFSARSNARRLRASLKRGFAPSWSRASVARGAQFRAARNKGVAAVATVASEEDADASRAGPRRRWRARLHDVRYREMDRKRDFHSGRYGTLRRDETTIEGTRTR